ncbi:MAG: phospholipase D family protein [Thermoplasmata archaeon]
MNRARIVVTGEALLGRGHRSIDGVMGELMENAQSELAVATYLLTSSDVLGGIVRTAQRGIRVTLVLNDFGGQPTHVRDQLRELAAAHRSVNLYDFAGTGRGLLHAKAMVSDRYEGIVGSANLTAPAMDRNHEIGMYVRGALAEELAALVDSLASRAERI